VDPSAVLQPLPVIPEPTGSLRLTVESVRTGEGGGVGIAEVVVPSLRVVRPVVVGWPDNEPTATVVLSASAGYRPECIVAADRPLCGPQLARVSEEQAGLYRVVPFPTDGLYAPRLTVRPRYGPELERLLAIDDGRISATATSRSLASPLGRPDAAVDRDLSTGWIAGSSDEAPTLTLEWGNRRDVSGLQFLVDPFLAASRPERVTVTVEDRTFVRTVDERGFVTFPPTRTAGLSVTYEAVDPVVSVDPRSAQERVLPVGVSELRVIGAEDLRRPLPGRAVSEIPCGFGPTIRVGSTSVPTRVQTNLSNLALGATVVADPCEDDVVEVEGSSASVTVDPSAEFDPVTLTLEPVLPVSGPLSRVNVGEVEVRTWEPTRRLIDVTASPSADWLVVTENYNSGWSASLDGQPLTTARIDGWAQGVLLPSGRAGEVVLTFTPNPTYQAALTMVPVGLIGLLLLAVPARGHRAGPTERRLHPVVLVVVTAAAAAVLTGAAGLVLLLLGLTATRIRASWAPVAAPLSAGLAGLIWATDPWPPPFLGASPVVQLLMAVSVAGLCAAVFQDPPIPRVPPADDPVRGTSAAATGTPASTS
jgi:arabinofuranan 3-O-arabinosyltransferase